MPSRLIVFLLSSLLASGLAQAQSKTMYKWTDENGKVQYSDKPPVEAAGRPSSTLTQQGQVLKKMKAH